jgi:hypothetical protein
VLEFTYKLGVRLDPAVCMLIATPIYTPAFQGLLRQSLAGCIASHLPLSLGDRVERLLSGGLPAMRCAAH